MCTIPPPPPPPTHLGLEPDSTLEEPQDIYTTFPDELCQWAANHPELREACIKNHICLHNPPFKYQYKHFASIKQEGPTCGLVALSMLINGVVSPAEILSIAKNEGFTNRGEMFSCRNLVKLAKKVISLADIEDIKLSAQTGEISSLTVINRLLEGSQMLVPYDADFNHYPCLKLGHKAHWALVCGVIVPVESMEIVYVLTKHGKSKYLALWCLNDLRRSNRNLVEFSPKREDDGALYILPDGGLAGGNGLKDQYVIVDRL